MAEQVTNTGRNPTGAILIYVKHEMENREPWSGLKRISSLEETNGEAENGDS
jgi:hypothetical protein